MAVPLSTVVGQRNPRQTRRRGRKRQTSTTFICQKTLCTIPRVHARTHQRTHTHTRVYTVVHAYAHTQAHTQICIYTQTRGRTYVQTHTYTPVHRHTRVRRSSLTNVNTWNSETPLTTPNWMIDTWSILTHPRYPTADPTPTSGSQESRINTK